ncbi:Gfo/Idh/MocA family protein [Flavobacterium sp. RSSA_27]|uniref:Gfo/Idh/MocA family protein n=1 Tax=Flavobacterium sp. RSSA_27 TaxID=3447667 RepID=UPI003F34667C
MNVLIIGLGSIARKHIKALQSLKVDAKIYALRSNLNAVIEEGVENIYNLDNNTIAFDFAIISNPTHLHHEFIEKLAHKGIPLFIEKPAIHSLENVDKLVKLIEDKKIITYVACNLRFHPCLTFLKNKLEKEIMRINEVNVYCGSYLPDWRPGKDFRTIYSVNPTMGGGVHLDLFHELDYTHWLFGKPLKVHSLKRNVSSLMIDAFDYANYVLEYESFTANVILNYYRKEVKRTIEILFENETLTIDLIKNTIVNSFGDFLYKENDFNIFDTYKNQLEYFIDGLKGNRKQMNTFADSIEVLKTCLNDE